MTGSLAQSVKPGDRFTPYTALPPADGKVLDTDRCLYLDADIIVRGLVPP